MTDPTQLLAARNPVSEDTLRDRGAAPEGVRMRDEIMARNPCVARPKRRRVHIGGIIGGAAAVGAAALVGALFVMTGPQDEPPPSGAIPEGEFHATGLLPPLPYPDASFDFVLASSVFTHLTAEVQDAWLRELHRVLRPGAILMATTHGEAAAEWVRDPAIDKALRKTGFFDSAPDEGLGHIASGDYYRATFQTADYTRTHWLEYFEELERRVAGLNFHQDVWMLRRR